MGIGITMNCADPIEARIIGRIIQMRDGTKRTTPQPEAARYEQQYFHELFLPHGVDINAAVAQTINGTP